METMKAWAALAGSILLALSQTTGVLPESWKPYVAVALAIVTAVATWAVPNKPKTEPTP
jgi:hypothetical protein